MKEFIEKLIGRLEEKIDVIKDEIYRDYEERIIEECAIENVIDIVNELAEEYRNDKVCQTAIMYAKNLHKYGIQIDSIWETATQQSMALNQAYMRGRQDERDIFDEWQEKHINTSTDTSSGWIPCSERLPKEHDSIFAECKGTNKWNEAMFEKISDDVNVTVKYENGTVKTMTTHTIDGKWKIDSIVKCEVLAWMPLPAPYKEGATENE